MYKRQAEAFFAELDLDFLLVALADALLNLLDDLLIVLLMSAPPKKPSWPLSLIVPVGSESRQTGVWILTHSQACTGTQSHLPY